MGILNVTPDSFSDGGRYTGVESAVAHARDMVQAGADMIDIGGESTRPGAVAVDEAEELRRVLPVIEALRAAEFPCGVVLMHMQGTPQTMQIAPHYEDVVAEVRAFFEERLALAQADGIAPERICLDPGIGFGKTVEHNLALIHELESLRVQNLPLLMALSRKRFLGTLWGDAEAARQSPLPTVVMSLLAAQYGADMHRVHDVADVRRSLALRAAVCSPNNWS